MLAHGEVVQGLPAAKGPRMPMAGGVHARDVLHLEQHDPHPLPLNTGFVPMIDPSVAPNPMSYYTSLVVAYARDGDWRGAEAVLVSMQKRNIQPDIMTYNSLINAHAKDGNFAGAEDVMRRLLERGVEPNVTTFNSIIKVSVGVGWLERCCGGPMQGGMNAASAWAG